MILDALHRDDDPGFGLPHPERLAVGAAVDYQPRRRDPRPERWMRLCWRCLWIALAIAAALRIALG